MRLSAGDADMVRDVVFLEVARAAADVLPHDVEHGGADQRVLDDEREQVRRGRPARSSP